jgi:hypothetical protein
MFHTVLTLSLILPLFLYQGAGSNKGGATLYKDQQAYEIYSAILQSESWWRDTHAKTLIIQTETKSFEMCLRPDKESEEKFGPAISDYVRLNAKPSLLQREIDMEIPYQLIMADQLNTNSNTGWAEFYRRYPDSKGWIELSAVGFNNDKTVAVVYMGHHCGPLCGRGGFHVLEKKAGRWVELKEWKGESCAWAA